eukprot:TRINITY_DN32999_c0_g1_i1.p1 TRINITY_DN32999_c0_g1~~TRINITY_DN32999_c0_g1_i1.p1  ORF type:complete len:341 (+),score=59.04 TRINITY_DN32999_c0_g1_i1:152-1174(+)
MEEFIAGIPKAELHLHIEGTLEPEQKFLFAKRNGVSLPYSSASEMRAAYKFDDLPSFLAQYYEGMTVLRTEEDFYDLTYAFLKKAHSQNVMYVEIFFDPQAHTSRGVPFVTVLSGIRRGQIAGEELGVKTQLIMCFLRDMSAESAMQTLEEALPHKAHIVGVGLDSDEKSNPPAKFTEVFARARQEGLRLTMHCDVDQEDATEHLRQAVCDIGVERVDHGVNCLDDPTGELVRILREREIPLTVCPISNRWVAKGLKTDAIRSLLRARIKVTINSDDPAYFGGYMTENLAAVAADGDLSTADVAQLCVNAFSGAWLPIEVRETYIATVERYVRERQPTTA